MQEDFYLLREIISEAKGLSPLVVDHMDIAENILDRIEAQINADKL